MWQEIWVVFGEHLPAGTQQGKKDLIQSCYHKKTNKKNELKNLFP